MDSFVCVHGDDPIRRLRWSDPISALREIRFRGAGDWGWTLPSSFNLCVEFDDASLYLVCSGVLTSDGIVLK